jgi:hypothetical protein
VSHVAEQNGKYFSDLHLLCEHTADPFTQCEPEDREWPMKCQLCVDKDLPCAPPTLPQKEKVGQNDIIAALPSTHHEATAKELKKGGSSRLDIYEYESNQERSQPECNLA